ncbi:MFS transporter, partial [Acidianus sp. RZ1]|uniref:MFS transporter n=1 Tax=Acidianus sp. RZ1 TaxID=1540082 RepID=UPI001492C7B4
FMQNKGENKLLISLLIAFFLGGFELTVSGSLNQIIASTFNSPSMAPLVISAYLAGSVIGSFLFGILVDSFGRKRTLEIGLIVFVLASSLIAISSNAFEFLILQGIQGLAIGGDSTAASPTIVEMIGKNWRGKAFVIVSTVWFLGDMLASIIGLYLLSFLPPSEVWRYSYLFALFLVIPFVFIRFTLKESQVWKEFGVIKRKFTSLQKRNIILFTVISSIDSIVAYVFPFILIPDFIAPYLGFS